MTQIIDYDSGRLTLNPTVNHGAPNAEVQWYHNDQLFTRGVDGITIPPINVANAIRAEDRGIYRANISNDFGQAELVYMVVVRKCE